MSTIPPFAFVKKRLRCIAQEMLHNQCESRAASNDDGHRSSIFLVAYAMTNDLNLVPPLVESGKFIDLVNAGQTISTCLSPADNTLAIFITNSVSLTSVVFGCSYSFFFFCIRGYHRQLRSIEMTNSLSILQVDMQCPHRNDVW